MLVVAELQRQEEERKQAEEAARIAREEAARLRAEELARLQEEHKEDDESINVVLGDIDAHVEAIRKAHEVRTFNNPTTPTHAKQWSEFLKHEDKPDPRDERELNSFLTELRESTVPNLATAVQLAQKCEIVSDLQPIRASFESY